MIIDSHCHAWRYWPYQPAVPDPESRGTVEQLLFEMDQNGIDQATIVCARIDHNPDNNDYVADAIRRHPDRLHQLTDVDCSWSDTYHAPGASQRMRETIEKYHPKGFTHYVKSDDDGSWYLSDEGLAFLAVAAEHHQIASFAIPPGFQPTLRKIAERFPSMPFLCHHMGMARASEPEPYPLFQEIVESAKLPNVFVKMSGFHYVSRQAWEYPFADCAWVVRGLYEHFGPDRLCWGSDYPVVRRAMTYQHALEAFRTHCAFIPEDHRRQILGENLRRLLAQSTGPNSDQ